MEIFKCDLLVKAFGLKQGDVVNFKKVKDTLDQIKKLYGNLGYINWSYLPEQSFDQKNKTMDLILNFQTDKRFYVKRINFVGNTKTRDKVMRREFILEEGKVFSSAALDMSVLRLNQLGFFDKIEEKDYEVKPDDKNATVDVDLKVKEKSQQSIGFTGGVSGISGSFLGVNYQTNNFLGRGETLSLSVTGGTRTSDFTASFTEPYLLDTRWSLGLSFSIQRFRYDTYSAFGLTSMSTGQPTELFTQKTKGTTITLNRRLGHSMWSFGGSYTYQVIGIGNIVQGFQDYALGQFAGFTPSNNPLTALNGLVRSEVTPTLSYNSTNSYFNPTRGTSVNLSAGIAGGHLGGDFNMVAPPSRSGTFSRTNG